VETKLDIQKNDYQQAEPNMLLKVGNSNDETEM